MAYAAPSIDQLFGGLPAEQRVERFEAYKAALSAVQTRTLNKAARGELSFERSRGIIETPSLSDRVADFQNDISKSLSGDQLSAVTSALANIDKSNAPWSLTSPLNNSTSGVTGLVPYNLDPVLSYLVPKELLLRNSIPRMAAQGQAFEFRRIVGLSNAGVGGVANLNTFFNSNTAATSFGGVTLNRPTTIQYAADKIVKSFVEQGVSDSVSMQAEFAGKGYTDLRQLSHTSLLYATMLGEERNILNARSTSLVATTAAPTFAAVADATGTGFPSSFNTQTVAVAVTLSSSFGETAPVSAGTVTGVTGQGAKVTYSAAIPSGTLAVNVYATYSGVTVKATSYNIASASLLGLAFATATLPSGDGSFSALAYDGFVSTLTDTTQSGYVKALNGALSTSEPGAEFQDAFVSLWNSSMADPDVVYTTAAIRRSLAKSIQNNASTAAYRLNYQTGSDGVVLGSMVQGIQNEATGKFVDFETHRFAPVGTAIIHSKQLPFPDSGVSNTVEVHNVVDTMVLEWPQIGFTYDVSSYIYGSLAFRAPAWSGCITNIIA
jgi:hypothetical protein